MSNSTKIVVVGAAVLVVALATIAVHNHRNHVETISRSDLRGIRAVINQSLTPWSAFSRANIRSWPVLLGRRLTLRIDEVKLDSISTVTIHPDGSVDGPHRGVTVWFHDRWQNGECSVEKVNGRWVFRGLTRGFY